MWERVAMHETIAATCWRESETSSSYTMNACATNSYASPSSPAASAASAHCR